MQALSPKNRVVLIVEDNPDDTFIVTKALETFGIRRIYAVDTAEGALDFLSGHACDVLLIDYNLPRMNGLTLMERVHETYPNVRVVIVTGVRDERVAVSAMKTGAVDYVTKDELLTSGIVRSVQAALRDEITAKESDRRVTLAAGGETLAVACEEATWLLDTLAGGRELQALEPGGSGETDYGIEGWLDLRNAFTRYLRESSRRFPDPAKGELEAAARMFMERGSSPAEILVVYRAALRSLDAEGAAPPFSPAICLVRLFAYLAEQYQVELSLALMKKAA